ncbi:HAMP domain-containing sensor histidine kinase [Saccharibacillus kuerlensis]|uniref:histidine kinase n=1 Tax=Saccharibacillus kuerlensis TaxID=459527 RepID=A0ABQ2L6K6_9BACL|nr:HAMP domain-containing sensor histidine kinase [Saccharibacillus kuerlensis]GGO02608.1 hypothetical protein GCM10010969_26110 [Saccharibacillus kuerlensis]
MESLNRRSIASKRFGFRSVLTEFMLLTAVWVSLVIFLSQATTHEAAQRYGVLYASYWDSLPYEWVYVKNASSLERAEPDESGSIRVRIYENGTSSPRFADFTYAHKLKGGFYLIVQYGAPYAYTILLLGGGLFMFYRHRVQQPLRKMIEAAERVSSGDLDFRIGTFRRDEFGRIGEAFEKMRGELERSNREMWRIAEERKRLNAAFSHDLRTPLAVLKGRIDLLADFYPSGELDRDETLTAISALRRNADRLEKYVASMSSVQKLEELEPQAREVELSELAEELSETGKALCGSKTLKFDHLLPGALFLDSDIISRVFENLIVNAERFASSSIVVSFDHMEDSLRIVVADDGPGFSADAIIRGIEPYYRSNASPSSEHFGLGLYLCRLLCEKHGGCLILDNNRSGGAKVTAVFQDLSDPIIEPER